MAVVMAALQVGAQALTPRDPAFLIWGSGANGGSVYAPGAFIIYGQPNVSAAVFQNLLAYYTFDNSGNFGADSVGSLSLTKNGSPGATTGVVNGAISLLNNSSDSLSHADVAGLRIDGSTSFTIAGWFLASSSGFDEILIAKNTANYQLKLNASAMSTLTFTLFNTTSGSTSVTSTASVHASQWTFFAMWYDKPGNTINIYVADPFNNSMNSAAFTGTPGASANSTFVAGFSSGLSGIPVAFDAMGIWDRVVTSAELAYLYNNGSGRQL